MAKRPAVLDGTAAGALGSALVSLGSSSPAPHTREIANQLAKVPLFQELSKRHVRHVANHAEEAVFSPGQTIVKEGIPGAGFYVIAEGAVRVVRGKRRIARLGAGDFFGEMALLDGQPRMASVVAETPVLAVRLSRKQFRKMVLSEPEVGLKIMEGLAGRLRKAQSSQTH